MKKKNQNSDLNRDIYNPDNPEPFINKHNDSFITGYLLNEPERRKELIKEDRTVTIIGYAMLLSLMLNIYQGTLPPKEKTMASYSNNDASIVRITTLPVAVNTVPRVLAWADRAVSDALSLGFADYDEKVEKVQNLFTAAGYAGFIDALNKNVKDNLLNNRMNLTTIPSGATIMQHMYSQREPWWTIQIPVIMTYSVGIEKKDVTYRQLLSIKIVPVKGSMNVNGKAIDSITLTAI